MIARLGPSAGEKGVKPQPYMERLSRIATPAEFKLIDMIRKAGHACEDLTSVEYDIMAFMLMSPEDRAASLE
jgi:hypothetical protein